jgi:hypothetical protein
MTGLGEPTALADPPGRWEAAAIHDAGEQFKVRVFAPMRSLARRALDAE